MKTFHKTIIILLLFFAVSATADEGQVQFNLLGGGFFPLSMKTSNETTLVFSTWNVGVNALFGVHDVIDIGLQYNYTQLPNTYITSTFQTVEGRKYFDWRRNDIMAIFKWYFYPWNDFRPALIIGAGVSINDYVNAAFYTKQDQLVAGFSEANYAKAYPLVAGGLDLQYRVWKYINLGVQLIYKWTPAHMGIELSGTAGGTFFIPAWYYR